MVFVDRENQALSLHYMSDIEVRGSIAQYPPISIEPDQCLTIIYTSGSSGFPKGAMVSEKAYMISLPQWCSPTVSDLINFCFEPLAWATDRDGIMRTYFGGGRTGFSTGDTSRLMEDLALVRPNHFSATPTVWNKIYAEFQATLALTTAHLSSEAIEKEEVRLLQQFSKLIPSRCQTLTVGGAMVSPVVFDFMKGCFARCKIYESYGTTECGSITWNNIIETTLSYRLISVPEMGYIVDDGLVRRGELAIKTEGMFSGYLNNSEETEAAFTEDGYYRTGDIVELRTRPKWGCPFICNRSEKEFFQAFSRTICVT